MNKIQSAKIKMQKSEFINTKPSSPFEGEGKVENPALRQAQGGERSRTTRGGGEEDVNLFFVFVLKCHLIISIRIYSSLQNESCPD